MNGVGTAVKSAGDDVWRAFGTRLLAFHYQMPMTYMCRCGETLVACSVLATARDLQLLPPLPRTPADTTGKDALTRWRAAVVKARAAHPSRRGSRDRRL